MDLRIFVEPQNGATYDDQLHCALLAERLGFDAFIRSDHFVPFGGDGGVGPTESWVTLAGLARETSTIRLGTLVSSATFRNPGVLAIQVAQIDAMSGGRVDFGLGTGWHAGEHAAYGIPFPSARFGILEEQLEVITGLWSTPVGETFSFTGEHYTLSEAPAMPKPVQSPIPVIVGGGGPKRTPAIAARFAGEFNVGWKTEAEFTAAFDNVRRACEAIGRDPESLVYSAAVTVAVGHDDVEVERRIRRVHGDPADFGDVNVVGSPQQAVDKIARLREAGASRVYLQTMYPQDLDHVELLGTEVLPHLR